MKTLTEITHKPYLKNVKELFSETGQTTQSTPTTKTESSEKNYWWLVSSPKVWRISSIKPGEEQDYSLYTENGNQRRVFQNFLDAQVGDLVIGYEANPVKKITALAEISRSADETGNTAIYVKKTRALLEPVTYAQVKENPALNGMEFLKNRNGSLFKLTKEEYEALMDMILEQNPETETVKTAKYTAEDFLSEVYMAEENYDRLTSLLKEKKNIILQGAPGVGKTFSAERLAYSLMGEKDKSRITFVQFHQNYSYEDFVMGYKPNEEGGFELRDGVFYKACIKAQNDPDRDHFFIIDEINRGNLSKIFGELLMLIENGYRDREVRLAYNGEPFSVPENLYIIGMMNTADRSLAMIDYALRRRFSFFEMKPGFDTEGFKAYQKSLEDGTFDKVIDAVRALNEAIEKDSSLGSGFCIGHSYFCGKTSVDKGWLRNVVDFDIAPMLREYWFDDKAKADAEIRKLEDIVK
jgi:MoxR-like ATPase/predicted RNA-binding protein with PUA-like domain